MKYILVYLLCAPLALLAQKHDYVWVLGDSNISIQSTANGGSVLDFNSMPPTHYYNWRELNLRGCNTSICDTAGNLLFYSNGCAIAGANDTLLENGNNINPGALHNQFCYGFDNGGYISGYQSLLTLPLPNQDSVYYMFHTIIENLNVPMIGLIPTPINFMYSKIDMRLNGGKGKVVEKNKVFYNNQVGFGEMTAIKHANGVDWWIVRPRRYNEQRYFSFLFTENGPANIPVVSNFWDNTLSHIGQGQCTFTPDGKKYIRYRATEGLYIFDFDRETGKLSNQVSLSFPEIVNTGGGCAVSPNSRYLYLTNLDKVYQLDLENTNDLNPLVLVAEYDGFGFPLATNFGICQLGPDCKIYITPGNDTKAYHIIHHPDEAGTACNLEQHGILFDTNTGASMPHFPNFRLGPPENPGLPCSPLVVGTEALPGTLPSVSVIPNPASREITVLLEQAFSENWSIQLYDLMGRMLISRVVEAGVHQANIDIAQFPTGMYHYVVTHNGVLLKAGHLVRQ